MSDELLEFAASSNGDRWLLGRDGDSGAAYVLHQANGPSGGARTRIELIDFLDRARVAPEHWALLVTIGTLLQGSGVAVRGVRPQTNPPSPTVTATDPAVDGGTLQ